MDPIANNPVVINNFEIISFLARWKEKEYPIDIARVFFEDLIFQPHVITNGEEWKDMFDDSLRKQEEDIITKLNLPEWVLYKQRKILISHAVFLWKGASKRMIQCYLCLFLRDVPEKGSRVSLSMLGETLDLHRNTVALGLEELEGARLIEKIFARRARGRMYVFIQRCYRKSLKINTPSAFSGSSSLGSTSLRQISALPVN